MCLAMKGCPGKIISFSLEGRIIDNKNAIYFYLSVSVNNRKVTTYISLKIRVNK